MSLQVPPRLSVRNRMRGTATPKEGFRPLIHHLINCKVHHTGSSFFLV